MTQQKQTQLDGNRTANNNTEIEVLNGSTADKGIHGLRQKAKDSPDITQNQNREKGEIEVL